MIGLGVGIDYALFIITRHRAGLARGPHRRRRRRAGDRDRGPGRHRRRRHRGHRDLRARRSPASRWSLHGRRRRDRRRGDGRRRDHAAPRAHRLRRAQHRPLRHPRDAPPRRRHDAQRRRQLPRLGTLELTTSRATRSSTSSQARWSCCSLAAPAAVSLRLGQTDNASEADRAPRCAGATTCSPRASAPASTGR